MARPARRSSDRATKQHLLNRAKTGLIRCRLIVGEVPNNRLGHPLRAERYGRPARRSSRWATKQRPLNRAKKAELIRRRFVAGGFNPRRALVGRTPPILTPPQSLSASPSSPSFQGFLPSVGMTRTSHVSRITHHETLANTPPHAPPSPPQTAGPPACIPPPRPGNGGGSDSRRANQSGWAFPLAG